MRRRVGPGLRPRAAHKPWEALYAPAGSTRSGRMIAARALRAIPGSFNPIFALAMKNFPPPSAYASLVRPRYPARKPASASRSASLNAGWMGTRAAVVVAVIGYLPVRAETDEAGPAAASATISHHHQAALSVTCCHSPRSAEPRAAPGNAPADSALPCGGGFVER